MARAVDLAGGQHRPAILREDRVPAQPKSDTSWQKAANHFTRMWPPGIGPWSNTLDREASEVDDADGGYFRFPAPSRAGGVTRTAGPSYLDALGDQSMGILAAWVATVMQRRRHLKVTGMTSTKRPDMTDVELSRAAGRSA
jgi:hypothetical protein